MSAAVAPIIRQAALVRNVCSLRAKSKRCKIPIPNALVFVPVSIPGPKVLAKELKLYKAPVMARTGSGICDFLRVAIFHFLALKRGWFLIRAVSRCVRFCHVNPKRYFRREFCNLLLRNPNGNKTQRNEYKQDHLSGVQFFSVFPHDTKIDWTKLPKLSDIELGPAER